MKWNRDACCRVLEVLVDETEQRCLLLCVVGVGR